MVILDVKTRWDLTFDMLVRARELREVSFFIKYIIIIMQKLKLKFLFLAT